MDYLAAIRSSRCSISHSADKTILSLAASCRKRCSIGLSKGKRPTFHSSCLKAPDTFLNSDDGSLEKNINGSLTFPNIFQSFVEEVCEETDIAEVKLKIGEFEVYVKRNIGTPKGKGPPATIPPAAEAKTVSSEATAVGSSVGPKAVVVGSSVGPKATRKVNPFTNTSYGKSAKLEALEACGISGFVTIASSVVGSFKSMRNNEKTPIVSVGDIIRKGGIVGYVMQSGRPIPLKSHVTGEVLEILVKDGDAIAYGDPIVAVLPALQ